ncbi:hypothetical protein F511_37701 [Dorcoceras hygrometricum]|uniref:Uncharacterized protein n=1 Tax=Dorcoceras hygrometricum TaxID=472368 RepID=A0A2Z7D1V4_9LAMI|nr:hypothetical protein F511_37701 [Dorcoceras hygrometricum]
MNWELRANQICPTLLTQQKALNKHKTTEGRCLRDPPPSPPKSSKETPNEASKQEDSNATTLNSVGAIYRRQSEKIRFGEQ